MAPQTQTPLNGSPAGLDQRPSADIPSPLSDSAVNARESLQKEPKTDGSTILYLAYGSNLCAETFIKRRGISPLSKLNVYVPLLEFNLNLPGIPYLEPCFANVNFRKPGLKSMDQDQDQPIDPWRYSDEKWDGGLMGVVYEVTYKDYRQIIRTEGGGSGYKEIVIPCVPIGTGSSTRHTQPDVAAPLPVFARTLYAPPPTFPDAMAQKTPWWKRLLHSPYRPNPGYSQASARYMKLITDGAREHDLPEVYQKYLASLQSYTITTLRQQIGRALFAIMFGPAMLTLMSIAERLADDRGQYPNWIASTINAIMNFAWLTYDHVSKPLFGDGERTESARNAISAVRRPSIIANPQIIDEEKITLMGE
jgi:hypothetical protein